MKQKTLSYILAFITVSTLLYSCAPEGYTRDEYGFFSGIWHGMIVVFSLIGKLLGMDIGIYADNNTGFTYWLGFIIGIGGFGRSSYRRY